MSKKPLTIIDAYSFLFRAYYVLPHLYTSSGIPIGGVYGFINIILKYLEKAQNEYLVVVFDSGAKSFRNDIYPKYKTNRPQPPADLIPQFKLLRELVEVFGISYEDIPGYEADDVIATICAKYNTSDVEPIVVTSDKDLFQLLSLGVKIFDPIKNQFITEEVVMDKFGVNSNKILDLLSLAGDAADNIPGVPSIGIKTAAKLLTEFGTLENLLLNVDSVTQKKCREKLIEYKEQALLSKKLLTLCYEVDITTNIEQYRFNFPDISKLNEFLDKYEFKTLRSRIEKIFQQNLFEESYQKSFVQDQIDLYSEEAFKAFLGSAKDTGVLAIKIDTDANDTINVISLAYSKNDIFVIDSNHVLEALPILQYILLDTSVLKIVYDLKFFMKFFPTIVAVDDIMVMSYSVDTAKHNHSFENIILHNLNASIQPTVAVFLLLHSALKQKMFLNKQCTVYERLDRPLVKVLFSMEANGVLLDKKILTELSVKFLEIIKNTEMKIFKLAGEEFNVASPKQLSYILFEKLKLNSTKKLKSGIFPTGADVLSDLADAGSEIAKEILTWRHFYKLQSTYTTALLNQINTTTNRVHTTYSMVSTTTGRITASNPNLQNIPIRTSDGFLIRRAFIATKGHKIISADYSQIELRLIAHIANVKAFQEVFAKEGDIHAVTANQIFGNSNKDSRRQAKSINFGVIYGISAFGLAKQLNINRADASAYISNYFNQYPEIKSYIEATKVYAKEHGYVKTLFGRRCFIKDINNSNTTIRQFAERAAINAPLQGTAADIIKLAMLRINHFLPQVKIILQVHDELLIEVLEQDVEDMVREIKKIMENIITLSVPLTVNMSVGDNWADIKQIN